MRRNLAPLALLFGLCLFAGSSVATLSNLGEGEGLNILGGQGENRGQAQSLHILNQEDTNENTYQEAPSYPEENRKCDCKESVTRYRRSYSRDSTSCSSSDSSSRSDSGYGSNSNEDSYSDDESRNSGRGPDYASMCGWASHLKMKAFSERSTQRKLFSYFRRLRIRISFRLLVKIMRGRYRYAFYHFFRYCHRSGRKRQYRIAFRVCMNKYGRRGRISDRIFNCVDRRCREKDSSNEGCKNEECVRRKHRDLYLSYKNYVEKYCPRRRNAGPLGLLAKAIVLVYNVCTNLYSLPFGYKFNCYFDYAQGRTRNCADVRVFNYCTRKYARNSYFLRKAMRCFNSRAGTH